MFYCYEVHVKERTLYRTLRVNMRLWETKNNAIQAPIIWSSYQCFLAFACCPVFPF